MNQKQKNNEDILLANTQKQPLKEHSIAVALYGHLLVKSLKFKTNIEKKINKYVIYSSLLHDIGKVSDDFQRYIKTKSTNNEIKDMPMDAESSRPKKFIGPFHNEISWAYIANFIPFNNNKETKSIVRHSVYWHHPANWNDKEDKLRFENARVIFDKEGKTTFQKIYEFTCDLFSSFSNYLSSFEFQPELKTLTDDIEEIQCPQFFQHKLNTVADNAYKQLCLNLLLESDRKVSSWTPDELMSFLKEWKSFKVNSNKKEKTPILESLKNNLKSKEQHDLAQKMAQKPLSVCGVDPAGGKTSIALYWWHHCHNNKHPLMIALPRQHQVTGLYSSIEEDSERIYGNEKIKIEGVFNGKRQHCNWKQEKNDDLLTSDINIMVFDRFLSPYYKRSQSSEFVKMLRSHLVLDEFHEFKDIPKMIPPLKEILTIRSWLDSEVKTLMLSGTPEPSLLELINVKDHQFKRSELSPRDGHKFQISAQERKIEDVNEFIPDCLYSFLKVESCQEVFSQFFKNKGSIDQIKLIHTYFTTKDKKELLENILNEHGSKAHFISDKSVITSKMLQSSYNISFNKALVELSQPYTDCQTAGRINRFENKKNSEIFFIYNEESEKFFDPRKADFKEVHQKWKQHILSFIQEQNGKFVSIRQLMNVYDAFWNKENCDISFNILKKQQEKAIQELNTYIPKRFLLKRNSKTPSTTASNSLFRGESRLLSACIVNDQVDPIDQLQGENLLSESRGWFIKKIEKSMETCLNTKSKCAIANEVKGQEVFDYIKYSKSFGFKTERPLLSSHINREIDQCLSKHLLDEDKNKTEHRVYHKKFGLVKKDILNILKK